MKSLLVGWLCQWALCEALPRWIKASWLVVTRRLPNSLRPELGPLQYEFGEEPEQDEDPAIALGEVVESEEDEGIPNDVPPTQNEFVVMDESIARAMSLGLRARR